MEESRLSSTENNRGAATPSATETTGALSPVSDYAQNPVVYPLEGLESGTSGTSTTTLPSQQGVAAGQVTKANSKPLAYSKRRALTASLAITVIVTLITGAMLFAASRRATPKQSAIENIPAQEIEVAGESTADSNLALLSSTQALVVKGDVIARGSLKIANNDLLGSLSIDNITENRTYQLPDVSGTLVTSEQVLALLGISVSEAIAGLDGTSTSLAGVTAVNSRSGALTLQGTNNQTSVATSGGTITIGAAQDIGTASSPTFGGLTVNGNVALGQLNTIFSNTLQQTAAGNDMIINADDDRIVFYANNKQFIFPTTGGTNQTICTTAITCASGGGQAVLLAPDDGNGVGEAQEDNTLLSSIFINKTNTGNLLQLQSSSSDVFVVTSAGAVTAATSVLAPAFDRASAGALAVGNSNATSISMCSSAACDTFNLANGGSDADAINIGDLLDTVIITGSGSASAINFGNGLSITATGNICAGLLCTTLDVDSSNQEFGVGLGSEISISLNGSTELNTTNLASTSATNIGNTNAATTITGATTINASGTNALSIGNTSSGLLTLQDSIFIDNNGNQESLGLYSSPFGGLGQYSNLLLRSEQLSSSPWTASGTLTVSADPTGSPVVNPAPNILNTAERLTSSSSGTHTLTQTYSSAGNNTYVFSIWLKGTVGNESVSLRVDSNGTPSTGTASTFTLGSSWKRYYVTSDVFSGSTTTVTARLQLNSNSANIGAWGAQLEQASTPGVYARTTATARTTTGIGLVSDGGAYIVTADPSATALTVQGNSSQTGDLINIQNNSGTSFLRIGTSATEIRGATATGADAATITVQGGSVSSGTGNGGNAYIVGGNTTSGAGGNVYIDGGTGSSNGEVNIGTQTTSSTIRIGHTSSTNTITLGRSSESNTINIGSSTTMSNNATQTINIGTIEGSGSGSGAAVTIGSKRLASTLDLWAGSGGIDIGTNAVVGGALDGIAAPGIQLGNTTAAVTQTINIGNNATSGSDTDVVMGSTTSGSTLTFQGGGGIYLPSSLTGTANTSTYLCRNSSNQLTTCATSGTGTAFLQGGNDLGSTTSGTLGTVNNGSLLLITNNTTRLTISTAGDATLTGRLVIQGTSTSTFGGQVKAGNSSASIAPAILQSMHTFDSTYNCVLGCYGGLFNSTIDNPTNPNSGAAVSLSLTTANTSFTLSTAFGLNIASTTRGAASTITNNYGLFVANQTAGSSDYGVYIGGADTYALWVDSGATRLDGTLEIQSTTTARDIVPAAASTYSLGSTSAEWNSIYLGDNNGLSLGLDQDATLAYDETTDDRVELTGTGATLFVEDRFSLGVDTQTIADNGGGTAATLTLNPSSSYVAITCNDTDGCDITMDEASPVNDGNVVYIINVGSNSVNFADTSGVSELASTFNAGQYDSLHMLYVSSRWVELARSNN